MMNTINDTNRLKTLLAHNIIDTPQEREFDQLAEIISMICKMPIAIISLIDDKRQWYKANIGMGINEVPIEDTICQHTLVEEDLLEIENTSIDPRVSSSPHVNVSNGIRYYAGVPLTADNGYHIGTVCVLDYKPRHLTVAQKKILKMLAELAMKLIKARSQNKKLETELESILRSNIEEKAQKIKLRESEYKQLFDAINLSSGIMEFNPEGIILSVNNNFLKMSGYEFDDLMGKHHNILLPEKDKELNLLFWTMLQSGKFQTGRYQRLSKDNTPFWIQASYNPVMDLNKKIKKIIKIAQDISLEIKAEKSLQEAKDLAVELNMQKDQFIANISHELRTPITSILGFTELLLEEEKDKVKFHHLHTIKEASETLLHLISDILDLSKIESGQFIIELIPFQLRESILNIISMMQEKAKRKGLQLRYKVDKNVPNKLIGDKHKLSQILLNLIGNAIKFSNQGSIEISVGTDSESSNDPIHLKFSVSDTGIGIDPNNLDLIFERFVQAEVHTTRQFGGTGLGLNICKHLVEMQGGSISVQSTLGKGSTFTFIIPYSLDRRKNIKKISAPQPEIQTIKPGKILVCEDNAMNQRLVNHILAKEGFEVTIASNGTEGINLFKKNSFDVILMDLQMPEKDGYATTFELRNQLRSNVPIIALTANGMDAEYEKCIKAGMNDFLSKPFTKKDLLSKINKWMLYTVTKKSEPKAFSELPETGEFSIDINTLSEFAGGDQSFMIEMLQLFYDNSQLEMQELKTKCIDMDLEGISKISHKLKSSFSLLGADPLFLEQLEIADQMKPSLEELKEILAALENQHLYILESVQNLISSLKTHN
ncbi:MAG TPA: response regulator [Saprospiraceae bacterium]|nr:response regulator [Saprospiraceae bacterium]